MFSNLIEFSICSCSLSSIEGLSFILITCPWEICWNCPSQRPLLLSNLAGRLAVSVTWRRRLTDSHASCSSFISLGYSAKNCIIAFMLNSRLAPSEDGLKKTQNIKTNKKPQTKLPCRFISPKNLKPGTFQYKYSEYFTLEAGAGCCGEPGASCPSPGVG